MGQCGPFLQFLVDMVHSGRGGGGGGLDPLPPLPWTPSPPPPSAQATPCPPPPPLQLVLHLRDIAQEKWIPQKAGTTCLCRFPASAAQKWKLCNSWYMVLGTLTTQNDQTPYVNHVLAPNYVLSPYLGVGGGACPLLRPPMHRRAVRQHSGPCGLGPGVRRRIRGFVPRRRVWAVVGGLRGCRGGGGGVVIAGHVARPPLGQGTPPVRPFWANLGPPVSMLLYMATLRKGLALLVPGCRLCSRI